jgi:hypothetical protein
MKHISTEKINLTPKFTPLQRQFIFDIGTSVLAAFVASLVITYSVSYKIMHPTKKLKVCFVDPLSSTLEAENINGRSEFYKVYYGSDDRVSKYIRYGDVLKCSGPRHTKSYFFDTDVSKINGIKTERYFKQKQQNTK